MRRLVAILAPKNMAVATNAITPDVAVMRLARDLALSLGCS
jgi:hypothetical protein